MWYVDLCLDNYLIGFCVTLLLCLFNLYMHEKHYTEDSDDSESDGIGMPFMMSLVFPVSLPIVICTVLYNAVFLFDSKCFK